MTSHFAPHTPPKRADELLVAQGVVESRAIAQRIIKSGQAFRADGSTIAKPSTKIPADEPLTITAPPRFVSQGGEKLESWFDAHPLDFSGLAALDVGASTGGFTDCLLQRGAAHVTGIDVGHGQLHPRLLDDERVTNIEGLNAKDLDEAELPHEVYPIVVADLSFISLKKVIEPIWNRVAPGGTAILLVKPQFEAPKEVISKTKGILRDDALRAETLAGVIAEATALPGCKIIGQIECPVAGGDGNREYLLGLSKSDIH
ncbi:TlyA family RNA methyltransferase [Cerasicoccus fimbriatus]|uniref:TlyA family RNA methyltransferase n=1 Tax=Cerasicoccus fimbriatus TaxID=3014554 RepID=UPI0022B45E2A|nr:TlyA family RNA methyltransferase [Cerasicoccus sp. TK19100]